jgi:hypothetical protein
MSGTLRRSPPALDLGWEDDEQDLAWADGWTTAEPEDDEADRLSVALNGDGR